MKRRIQCTNVQCVIIVQEINKTNQGDVARTVLYILLPHHNKQA